MSAPRSAAAAPRTGGREISGRMLRAVLAVASAGVVAVSLTGGAGASVLTGVGLVLIGLGVVTVAAPGSPAATFLLIAALGIHLMLDTADIDVGVVMLTALIPLVHQLSGICAVIPMVSRVTLTALRPAAIRYAAAVGVVLIAVLVAALV